MVEYSVPGFKMSFPENFIVKGQLPCIYLKDSVTYDFMEITLLDKNTNFEDECQSQFNPDNTWEHEIYTGYYKYITSPVKVIKLGDCSTHPGAKERWYGVEKYETYEQEIKTWLLLIPVEERIICINIPGTGTGTRLGLEWQQIIDSMEFSPDLIADIPGCLDEIKNSLKLKYSSKSLQVIYPEIMIRKGNISSFKITHPVLTKNDLLLKLYKDEVPVITDPSSCPSSLRQELIRKGDSCQFYGGRESIIKYTAYNGNIFYTWELLVPIGKYWVYIVVYSYTLKELETIWKPIVESIEFNTTVISKLPDEEDARKQNWKKTTEGQSQYVHIEFSTLEHFVGLYAAKGKLFTKSELDDDTVIINLIEEKWYKKNKRLLLSISTDPLCLPVDIYFNTDPPAENDPAWDQIIEGFINLSAGKMFIADGYYDSDPSLEIVLPQKGIYKFRIYYGGLSPKTFTEEHWQIYLWLTDETIETNEIKVVKAFKKA